MNVSSLFVGYLLLKAVVKKMPKSCCAVGCSNHNMMNPLFIPSLIISVKVNQFIVFYVSYDVESHVDFCQSKMLQIHIKSHLPL